MEVGDVGMPGEAKITINGDRLTDAEVMTVHVAIDTLALSTMAAKLRERFI